MRRAGSPPDAARRPDGPASNRSAGAWDAAAGRAWAPDPRPVRRPHAGVRQPPLAGGDRRMALRRSFVEKCDDQLAMLVASAGLRKRHDQRYRAQLDAWRELAGPWLGRLDEPPLDGEDGIAPTMPRRPRRQGAAARRPPGRLRHRRSPRRPAIRSAPGWPATRTGSPRRCASGRAPPAPWSRPGASWGLDGAEAVLKMRGLVSNGGQLSADCYRPAGEREHCQVVELRLPPAVAKDKIPAGKPGYLLDPLC
jgi:hypothetical protein